MHSGFIGSIVLFAGFFGIFLSLTVQNGCHYYNLTKQLSPSYADFLSKVRYIITREEEKNYLDLPDSEKDAFIEEFWKRRDPTPDTEENEFKMEYFDRIEQADDLFLSEGIPGWRTDRGRIYILFGPPLDRLKNPMGYSSSSQCSEVWYYGNFPVVFLDMTCSGDYKLVTYDLTPLRSQNLLYMHELNMAQSRAQQTIQEQNKAFNFRWNIRKTSISENRIEGVVSLNIPYANIWFTEENGTLKTTLDIHLELKDVEEKAVWNHHLTKNVAIRENILKKNRSKKLKIDIPFTLTGHLSGLRKGKARMYVILKNRTGGKEIKKYLDIRFTL